MFCPKCGNKVDTPFCMNCGLKIPEIDVGATEPTIEPVSIVDIGIKERIVAGLAKFKPVLKKALVADINESDTVTIIVDMLCDIFGYDKYENVTSEFAIKRTFCDLAIKLNGKVPLLIECKAAGIDLKDDHIRQATNYAADSGIEWVALTNGSCWKIFKIIFAKPIDKQLVYEFNLFEMSGEKQSDIEMLYYLCIEAFQKSSKATLDDLHAQKQVLNRYVIGQILLTEPAIDSVRKLLRKLYPDIRAGNETLHSIISNEIFKREIIEGDLAVGAKHSVGKAVKKMRTVKMVSPVPGNLK